MSSRISIDPMFSSAMSISGTVVRLSEASAPSRRWKSASTVKSVFPVSATFPKLSRTHALSPAKISAAECSTNESLVVFMIESAASFAVTTLWSESSVMRPLLVLLRMLSL